MISTINSEKSIDLALKDAMKFHNERISIINVDPSSRTFLYWFVVSCYFPVITACLGPIANTISIACVVERWRGHMIMKDGDMVEVTEMDPKGIFAVNILSLIFGFTSNIVLILHFTRKLGYLTSQVINITGWSLAGGMLLVDVIICSKRYIEPDSHRTIGFWFGCITSGLYIACAVTLLIHFIGFKLEKYPATFNLRTNERSIIIFTVFLSLWLIWGSGMFSGLLGISWGNSLYFCTVSVLTVGFGDEIPNSVAGKIMVLIFAVVGVLLLGLIVFMTRSIIQKSSGPVFYFYRLEMARTKAWSELNEGNLKLSNKESFDLMLKYKHGTKIREHLFSLVNTTIIFMMFWLLGAMVFHFAENWSYFNCIYFCFLCLLTIGFGTDFSPTTGAGRAFFVIWAIGAVPLMGAILSTLGDLLFDFSKQIDLEFAKRFGYAVRYTILQRANKKNVSLILTENAVVGSPDDAQDVSESSDITNSLDYTQNCQSPRRTASDPELGNQNNVRAFSRRSSIKSMSDLDPLEVLDVLIDDKLVSDDNTIYNRMHEIKSLVRDLKKLHQLSISDQNYRLNFQQWTNLRLLNNHTLEEQNNGESVEESNYWLSDNSPLKFSFNEPHYAFNRLYKCVEREIDYLIQQERETIIFKTQSRDNDQSSQDQMRTTRGRGFTIQSLPNFCGLETTQHPITTTAARLRRSMSNASDKKRTFDNIGDLQ